MPDDLLLALIATGLSVAFAVGYLAYRLLSPLTTERQRIRAVLQPSVAGLVVQNPQLVETVDPMLARLSKVVPKSPKDMSRLRRRLAAAGYRSPWAAVAVAFGEVILPVVVGGGILLSFGIHNRTVWIAAALAAVVAFFVPGLIVENRIAARKKQIRNGLPDLLDLLIVCLEAGSSMDQAIVKATEELGIAYPALAEEMTLLTTETRAGKPRLEAFKNLAQRTRVDDIRALVAMLVQTDRFGTSVGQALRTFADSLRTRRRQLAEERAAKIGVKLVFPLVFLLFPAFYVVTLGPAIIQFVRVFFGQVVNR
ncbi:MAG: type II secretion system F family protein [Vicinamibacterales bacterium]